MTQKLGVNEHIIADFKDEMQPDEHIGLLRFQALAIQQDPNIIDVEFVAQLIQVAATNPNNQVCIEAVNVLGVVILQCPELRHVITASQDRSILKRLESIADAPLEPINKRKELTNKLAS